MDLSSEISTVLDKHGVDPKHGGKLIGDLMGVAMKWAERQQPPPKGFDSWRQFDAAIDDAYNSQFKEQNND